MPDVAFNMEWVPNTYAARVQRAAVLYPLAGYTSKPAEIVEKSLNLVSQYRALLYSLQAYGFMPRGTATGLRFARNCPPPFAFMSPQTRPCTLRQLCPFCYARWVHDVWRTIDNAFPNPGTAINTSTVSTGCSDIDELLPEYEVPDEDDSNRTRVIDLGGNAIPPPRVFPYHLIERKHTIVVQYAGNGENPIAYIRDVVQRVIAARGTQIAAYKHKGAFHFTTIAPSATGWKIKYRTLLKVLPTSESPDWTGNIRRIEQPTRKEVFKSVVRVCNYPVEIFRDDPEMVATLMLGKGRLRMSAMYGSFRNHLI